MNVGEIFGPIKLRKSKIISSIRNKKERKPRFHMKIPKSFTGRSLPLLVKKNYNNKNGKDK